MPQSMLGGGLILQNGAFKHGGDLGANRFQDVPFPQFGLAASLMYLPAKFKIRFLEPVSFDHYGPEDADDLELVQTLAEEIRGRIQTEVDRLVASRRSVWFG